MLSSKEIEGQIRNYKLNFIGILDERIEWGMRFPMFVDTFDKLVQVSGHIPSQEEFVERYFRDNSSKLSSVLSNERLKRALEARLRRTYPSFVRDVHFCSLLREKNLQVSHNRDIDVARGVDHIIQYKGKTFYVHCFVGTRRGKFGRRVKERRHRFTGAHIDVVLNLGAESAREVGDFYLYSEKHVENVIQEMEARLKHMNPART